MKPDGDFTSKKQQNAAIFVCIHVIYICERFISKQQSFPNTMQEEYIHTNCGVLSNKHV